MLFQPVGGGGGNSSKPVKTKGTFGVYWSGGSSTTMTRTDNAESFSNPVAATSGSSGSSPFDSLYPWAGMQKVYDEQAGYLVSIPKFYYKWTRNSINSGDMMLQITNQNSTGFYVSPAHANRGDGAGERDIVYVGAHHCVADYNGNNDFRSLPNYYCMNGYEFGRKGISDYSSRSAFREGIHNLGSKIWQWDYAMFWTIAMLYLVEYANWDSQSTIGYGGHIEDTGNFYEYRDAYVTGQCAGLSYHTGTSQSTRYGHGPVMYRWIEDLWSCNMDWVDGIYFNNQSIYCIKNPSNFGVSGGTFVGSRPQEANYYGSYQIRGYTNPSNVPGYEWALYPNNLVSWNTNNTYNTYFSSFAYNGNGTGEALHRGATEYMEGAGMFSVASVSSDSGSGSSISSRVMKLP